MVVLPFKVCLFSFKHNAEVAVREMLKEIAAKTKVRRDMFWIRLHYLFFIINTQQFMMETIETLCQVCHVSLKKTRFVWLNFKKPESS